MLEHTIAPLSVKTAFLVGDASQPLLLAPLIPSGHKEELLKKLPEDLPQRVRDQIAHDNEVRNIIEQGSMSLSGHFAPVRMMIVDDFVYDRSRGAYENQQGVDDFGYLHEGRQDWKPPRIEIEKDGITNQFDGSTSFYDCDSFAWMNHGMMNFTSVLTLGENPVPFDEKKFLRDGGFGQGLKIAMTVAVSSTQDKINILRFHRNHPKVSLNDVQKQAIDAAIARLEARKESEKSGTPFVTVQSRRKDGSYFRVYAFRRDASYEGEIEDVPSWKFGYVAVNIDPVQVPEEYRDMVVVRYHNPDRILAQAYDHARENLLKLNPLYDSPRSMVRNSQNIPPPAPRREYRSDQMLGNPVDGYWVAERLDIYPPKLYFRGTAMRSRNDPDMILDHSWNIREVDAKTIQTVNRTNDSTEVTGEVQRMIEACVGSEMTVDDWEQLLRRAKELLETSEYSFDWYNRPELRPRVGMKPWDEHDGDPVGDQIREAYERVWPGSDHMYASNAENVTTWNILSGTDVQAIPVIAPQVSKNISYLRHLLERGDIKDLGGELMKLLAEKLHLSPAGVIQYDRLSASQRESLARQPKPADATEEIFQFILGRDAGVNFHQQGYAICLNEQGEIELVLEKYSLPNVVHLTRHGGIFDSPGKPELEDDGSLTYIPTSEYSRLTSPEAHAIMRIPQFLFQMKELGFDVEIEAPSGDTGESYGKLVTHSVGDEKFVAVGKNPNATTRNQKYQIIRIKGKSAVEMDQIVQALYLKTAEISPEWAARASLSSIQQTTLELRKQQEKTSQLLESQIKQLGLLLKEMETAAEVRFDEPSNFAAEAEDAGVIGESWGEDGISTRQVFPDSGFGRTRAEFTIRGAKKRPNDFDTAEKRGRQKKAQKEGKHVREKVVTFDVPHYRAFFYDGNPPDFYPDRSFNAMKFDTDGITLSTTQHHFVSASRRVNGETIWRGQRKNEKKNYLARFDKKGNGPYYDGYVEAGLDIIPGANGECTLPIDGYTYEIAYIQVPVDPGNVPAMPRLLYDQIGNQYHLIVQENNPNALKTLPKGSVIYIKRREAPREISDEVFLQNIAPGYYASLTRPLARVENLDPELQMFLARLDGFPLTRRQKTKAIYEFWVKRRRYDEYGSFISPEDLLANGVGSCAEAAAGELDLLRLARVPVRYKGGYPDNNKSGTLAPPYHAELEILNDEGMWERYDPPNWRRTVDSNKRVIRAIMDGEKPVIHDAPSLARERQEFDARHTLPSAVVELLSTIQTLPGEEQSEGFCTAQERILRGQGDDLKELELLELVTAMSVGKPTDKQSLHDALIAKVTQAQSRSGGDTLAPSDVVLEDIEPKELQKYVAQITMEGFSQELTQQIEGLKTLAGALGTSPKKAEELSVRLAYHLTTKFLREVLSVGNTGGENMYHPVFDSLALLFDHPDVAAYGPLEKANPLMANVLQESSKRYRISRFVHEIQETQERGGIDGGGALLILEAHPRRQELFQLLDEIATAHLTGEPFHPALPTLIDRFDTIVHEMSRIFEGEVENEMLKQEFRSACHRRIYRRVQHEKRLIQGFPKKQRNDLYRGMYLSFLMGKVVGREEAEVYLPGMAERAYRVQEYAYGSLIPIQQFCEAVSDVVARAGLSYDDNHFKFNYEMAMAGDDPFTEKELQRSSFRSVEEEFFTHLGEQLSDEKNAELFRQGGPLFEPARRLFFHFLNRDIPMDGRGVRNAIFPTWGSLLHYVNRGEGNQHIFAQKSFREGEGRDGSYQALHGAYLKFLEVNYPNEFQAFIKAYAALHQMRTPLTSLVSDAPVQSVQTSTSL